MLLGRRFGDILLFGVTLTELALLFRLTPAFTFVDWIYVSQHVIVLAIALMRPAPAVLDTSLRTGIAVVVSYTYPYAQVAYLRTTAGEPVSEAAGFVLVMIAAFLSLASLVTLRRSFGVRPALRTLVTGGPYALVRHPMYLSYVIGDLGYNLQEWNTGTVLLSLAGWASALYRIRAEERVLCSDAGWARYAARVRFRLFPGIW